MPASVLPRPHTYITEVTEKELPRALAQYHQVKYYSALHGCPTYILIHFVFCLKQLYISVTLCSASI